MDDLFSRCDEIIEHLDRVSEYIDKGESDEFLMAIIATQKLKEEGRLLCNKLKTLPPSDTRIFEYIAKMEKI